MRRTYLRHYATLLFFGVWAFVLLSPPLHAQKSKSKGVGIVYGKVLKADGKPLAGAWLMIENLELGMIYRKDINPIGQFQFDDVYPGTYVFKLSPAVYLIKSPAQITAKADQALEVEVRVVPAPQETLQ
jgi:hypothetical protein